MRFPTRPVALTASSLVTAFALLAATPTPAVDANWNVDAAHTEINFSVKHFFTPVTGTFTDYSINLEYDAETPENSSVQLVAQVASVSTGNDRRDAHLQSEDFFEAATYPELSFTSTSVREAGAGQLIATGDLTIKGVTKTIDLPVTVLGIAEIPPEMQEMLGGVVRVASFAAETQIDRNDYGVGVGSWAATLVVGGEVDISIAVEANQK